MEQIEFESKLMEMLLSGDHPVLRGLMNQYNHSVIESREYSGAGFFTRFKITDGIESVAQGKSFQITGVYASWKDIKAAFGFMLFVERGYLTMLEGYTLSSDTWPDDYSGVVLKYNGPEGRRDFDKLKSSWS